MGSTNQRYRSRSGTPGLSPSPEKTLTHHVTTLARYVTHSGRGMRGEYRQNNYGQNDGEEEGGGEWCLKFGGWGVSILGDDT